MRWCVRTFRELTAAIISCCEHGMFLQQRGNPQAAPSSARRWPWTEPNAHPNSGTAGHLSGRDRAARCPIPKGRCCAHSRPGGDPGCQPRTTSGHESALLRAATAKTVLPTSHEDGSRFNICVAQRKRLPIILARRRRRQETIDRTKYPAQKPRTNATMATATPVSMVQRQSKPRMADWTPEP